MTPQEQKLIEVINFCQANAIREDGKIGAELLEEVKQMLEPAPAQGVEEDCEYAHAWEDYSRGVEEGSQGREKADKYDFRAGWIAGSRWQQGQDNHRGFTVTRGDGNKYQLCPKCNGQGRVSKPPHIPEGVDSWSSCELDYECNVCNGQKIILSPQPPAPTIGPRWVRASERLPKVNIPICFRIFERRYSGKYAGNGEFKSNAHACSYGVGSVEWLDESPATLDAGWIPGTPKLEKPCVFASKSGNDYSVWEVLYLDYGDGSYLAIVDGNGMEWDAISDFKCDAYCMLPVNTFPTREEAEEWAKSDSKHVWFEEECLAALAMYDWIFNPQKDK